MSRIQFDSANNITWKFL